MSGSHVLSLILLRWALIVFIFLHTLKRGQTVILIKPLDTFKLELKEHLPNYVREYIKIQSKTISIVIQTPWKDLKYQDIYLLMLLICFIKIVVLKLFLFVVD